MDNVLLFVKKLHTFAGKVLYFNLFSMIIISFIEGIGILLLIPMLSLIGIFDIRTGSIPLLSSIQELLYSIPAQLHLPVILGVYILLITGQALLQRKQSILDTQIQQGFSQSLRLDMYEALLKSNWIFFLKRRNSDFQHVLTSELGRVNHGTYLFLRLLTSIIFTVIQIGIAFCLSAKMTVLVVTSGFLLAVISRRFVKYSKIYGNQTTELAKSYYAGITDQFNGIKDIKSNMLEQSHYAWFHQLCKDIELNVIQLTKVQSNSQILYKVSSAVLIGMFIYVSLTLFQVQAGQLMLILIIFARLWPRFTGIQASIEQIASALPAFKSLIELHKECEQHAELKSLQQVNGAERIQVKEGMECRNVYFRYDHDQDSYALHHVNLSIPAQGMTAIVGRSGAGKSTLIDMLMGLIQPESGEVLVDGTSLTAETVPFLRKSIGYVSQDPFLFHTSIRANLLLVAPQASEGDLWEALRFSASDEFVRRLPQGLDTVIGDRGVRLSGGERQRIVLARAILRQPSILVLDEATSSLDTENETKIQEALDRIKGTMSIIVIAHRLSTIRNADQVIVMEEGRVIQQGGFQQLSKEAKGTFNKLLIRQNNTKKRLT